MRYLLLIGILFGLMGCGSSNTQEETPDQTIKPTSPSPMDSTKQPPSIPDI